MGKVEDFAKISLNPEKYGYKHCSQCNGCDDTCTMCNGVGLTNWISLKVGEYLTSPEIQALSKSTQYNYRYALNHLMEFIKLNECHDFETVALGMLDFTHHYLRKRKKISEKSTQQYLTSVKIFMKWAGHPVDFTYRISNYGKKQNQRKQLRRWFNEEDIARCLAYKFEKYPKEALTYQVIVRLLHDTGARVREIASVEAEHIDLEDNIIWLMDSKTEPRAAFFSPKACELITALKQPNLIWTGPLFPGAGRIKQVVLEMLEDLGLKNGKDGRGPCFLASQLSS